MDSNVTYTKLQLLDDVIQRFVVDKKEHATMRERYTSQTQARVLPVQKIGELKALPERPSRTAQNRALGGHSPGLQRDPSSGRPGGKKVLSKLQTEETPGIFVAGHQRSSRIRDGKAVLHATTTSVQPVFREIKPIELGHDGTVRSEEEHERATDRVLEASDDFTLDLIMLMNSENLVSLKQQFAKFRNELDVYQFVSVMQQNLPHAALSTNDRIALIANLKELFDQVDVNGDGRMEWSELTSFIVEAQHGGPLQPPPLSTYRQVETKQDESRLRSEQSSAPLPLLEPE